MFKYLIYTSKATQAMEEEDLFNLLNESKQWNADHGITGMMLYIKGGFLAGNHGRFIQVLEGTETEIDFIFEKIKTDYRHHQLVVLTDSKCDERNFADWSMGFKSFTSNEYSDTLGYFEPHDKILENSLKHKFNAPLTMLRSFYLMHANS